MKQYVFAYGTLRSGTVRKELLAYNIPSEPAQLKGFTMNSIVLDNIEYPILIENPDSPETIEGEYFEIDEKDLEKLDVYESSAYRRKEVTLENHKTAWVYMQ